MALSRVWIPSPNYSSRGGARVKLVVVHTAEGALTYQALGSFFSNPASGVSSHTGIDDTPNTVGEYVRPDQKAWTAASFNPQSIQTELCAFAGWTAAQWNSHPVMLENCAKWITEECARFGIPKVRLTAAQAQGGASGVCGHNELGAGGGGHWDPGPNFPWDRVMQGGAPGPGPAPPTEGDIMAVNTATSKNHYWVFQMTQTGDLWRKMRNRAASNWYNMHVTSAVWGPGAFEEYQVQTPAINVTNDGNTVECYVEVKKSGKVRMFKFRDGLEPPGAEDLP